MIGLLVLGFVFQMPFVTGSVAHAQAPGTTPVEVSTETQLLHGRRYYVHIVKKGQTVYSISRAYKVESYDAVTHHDIHFLHEGDTVWLPARGQFGEQGPDRTNATATPVDPAAPGNTTEPAKQPSAMKPMAAPTVRPTGKVLKVGVMMPLHLDQLDQVSTSKFDVEQRGKKSYRQFEFIEFYEGLLLALDRLNEQGVSVELNVADVSQNNAVAVEEAFRNHNLQQSDFVIALLLREAFDRAADLAQQHGVYIINPMATRSELCEQNPYMVKIQPSVESQIELVLRNMKVERPEAHLYVIHSGAKAEKPVMDELKRQLTERGDIPYTLFNWSQSARLTQVLKATPGCEVLSIFDQGKDENRVFCINLLNRLSSIKKDSPTLYSLADWTRDYGDIDYGQLQLLNYHTFSLSWDMNNEVHVDFLKSFRSRFGNEPTSQLAATAYDLMLYIAGGLSRHGSDFWLQPGTTLPQLIQPLHLKRRGAGLENSKSQLYRMENLHFIKAQFK